MSEAAASLIVDASVVVKWYVPEHGSNAALAILASAAVLLAPDLLVAELGNVLWKKVGRGELSGAEAQRIAQGFFDTAPVTLWPSSGLLDAALEVALTRGCTVYDALYLALALAHRGQLVTADQRLVRSLRGTDVEPSLRSLEAE